MPEGLDFFSKDKFTGEVAERMVSNGNLNTGMMRPFVYKGKSYVSIYKGGDPKKPESYKTVEAPLNVNGTLRRDEWKQLDEVVLQISETRLNGIQDLIDKGLTYNLGNAMGTTVLEYHDISDALSAEVTMDGVTKAKGDRPEFNTVYLPIPIIHADYEINERALRASRNLGNPLDTTFAERAARKVSEELENMLFASNTYSWGNGVVYSYLNHPNRNQVTLSDYGNWDDSATTAANIIQCVIDMKQTSINAKHSGPWMVYVPTAYETVLDEDYVTAAPQNTVRDRILKIGGIQGIKVIDTLPANNVLLVQMTSDVVRLVRGMGITNVEWTTEGRFIHKYKVMTIQVPQVRADQEGNSGIVHAA